MNECYVNAHKSNTESSSSSPWENMKIGFSESIRVELMGGDSSSDGSSVSSKTVSTDEAGEAASLAFFDDLKRWSAIFLFFSGLDLSRSSSGSSSCWLWRRMLARIFCVWAMWSRWLLWSWAKDSFCHRTTGLAALSSKRSISADRISFSPKRFSTSSTIKILCFKINIFLWDSRKS